MLKPSKLKAMCILFPYSLLLFLIFPKCCRISTSKNVFTRARTCHWTAWFLHKSSYASSKLPDLPQTVVTRVDWILLRIYEEDVSCINRRERLALKKKRMIENLILSDDQRIGRDRCFASIQFIREWVFLGKNNIYVPKIISKILIAVVKRRQTFLEDVISLRQYIRKTRNELNNNNMLQQHRDIIPFQLLPDISTEMKIREMAETTPNGRTYGEFLHLPFSKYEPYGYSLFFGQSVICSLELPVWRQCCTCILGFLRNPKKPLLTTCFECTNVEHINSLYHQDLCVECGGPPPPSPVFLSPVINEGIEFVY